MAAVEVQSNLCNGYSGAWAARPLSGGYGLHPRDWFLVSPDQSSCVMPGLVNLRTVSTNCPKSHTTTAYSSPDASVPRQTLSKSFRWLPPNSWSGLGQSELSLSSKFITFPQHSPKSLSVLFSHSLISWDTRRNLTLEVKASH